MKRRGKRTEEPVLGRGGKQGGGKHTEQAKTLTLTLTLTLT